MTLAPASAGRVSAAATTTATIRRTDPADAAAMALVAAATFLETYAEIIPGGDIVAHCARRHGIDTYTDWLADPANTLLLAETPTGAPIGYLVMTRATLPDDHPHPDDLEVQRIYVLSRFHGMGLGHRLMCRAIEAGRTQRARRLVLGVLKTNARAVTFYERQGFHVIDVRRFTVGSSVFDDVVMGMTM